MHVFRQASLPTSPSLSSRWAGETCQTEHLQTEEGKKCDSIFTASSVCNTTFFSSIFLLKKQIFGRHSTYCCDYREQFWPFINLCARVSEISNSVPFILMFYYLFISLPVQKEQQSDKSQG